MPRTATEWLKEPENRQLVTSALRRRKLETDSGIHIICEFDEAAMAVALTCFAEYMAELELPPEIATAYELQGRCLKCCCGLIEDGKCPSCGYR
jgi:hypothetical protein